MITLENRRRSVWRFPVTETKTLEDGSTHTVQTGVVVLGDARDAGLSAQELAGRPSPTVRLSQKDYEALGERNLLAIEGLVDSGEITRIGA